MTAGRRARPALPVEPPQPSLDGIVRCLDVLALEAAQIGHDAVGRLLQATAGEVRLLQGLSGDPRRRS